MSARFVVGPVVVLPTEDGKQHYFYQGAELPDGLVEERVQAAITDGLVSEDVKGEELTADDLSASAAGDRLRAANAAAATAPDAAADGGPPPKAANKDAWVDYAVSQGADRGEAEASTKDDLIAKYGD